MNHTKEIALLEQGQGNAVFNTSKNEFYQNQATFLFLKEGHGKLYLRNSGQKITKNGLADYLTSNLYKINLKIKRSLSSLGFNHGLR